MGELSVYEGKSKKFGAKISLPEEEPLELEHTPGVSRKRMYAKSLQGQKLRIQEEQSEDTLL